MSLISSCGELMVVKHIMIAAKASREKEIILPIVASDSGRLMRLFQRGRGVIVAFP